MRRLGQRAVLELVDGDVRGEVVDAVERLAERERERLGRRRRRPAARRPGPGPAVTAIASTSASRTPGVGAGPLDRRHHRLEVRAAGDLGHDAAEAGVLVDAARDRVGEQRACRGRCRRRSRRRTSRCRAPAARQALMPAAPPAHGAAAHHDRVRARRRSSRAAPPVRSKPARLVERDRGRVVGAHLEEHLACSRGAAASASRASSSAPPRPRPCAPARTAIVCTSASGGTAEQPGVADQMPPRVLARRTYQRVAGTLRELGPERLAAPRRRGEQLGSSACRPRGPTSASAAARGPGRRRRPLSRSTCLRARRRRRRPGGAGRAARRQQLVAGGSTAAAYAASAAAGHERPGRAASANTSGYSAAPGADDRRRPHRLGGRRGRGTCGPADTPHRVGVVAAQVDLAAPGVGGHQRTARRPAPRGAASQASASSEHTPCTPDRRGRTPCTRAVTMPTRSPVNGPGPTPTAIVGEVSGRGTGLGAAPRRPRREQLAVRRASSSVALGRARAAPSCTADGDRRRRRCRARAAAPAQPSDRAVGAGQRGADRLQRSTVDGRRRRRPRPSARRPSPRDDVDHEPVVGQLLDHALAPLHDGDRVVQGRVEVEVVDLVERRRAGRRRRAPAAGRPPATGARGR